MAPEGPEGDDTSQIYHNANDVEKRLNVRGSSISITVRTALEVVLLGYGSLGTIFGDIGTSPLYVLNSIFQGSSVSENDISGATSCMFWLFSLVVVFKYALLVLTLGSNDGQGGQIAIYCKLSRVLGIGQSGQKYRTRTTTVLYDCSHSARQKIVLLIHILFTALHLNFLAARSRRFSL